MKSFLEIRVVVKLHVMMVALSVLLPVGATIAKPSSIESRAFPPWHEGSELLYGDLQFREYLTKDWINGETVLWPIDGTGIKTREQT